MLARLFARLSIYRAARGVPLWVLVALAVVFYALAAADARAHVDPTDTKAVAYDKMQAYKQTRLDYCIASISPSNAHRFSITMNYTDDKAHPAFFAEYRCYVDGNPTNINHYDSQQWHYNVPCAAGENYVRETDSCVDPAAACLAKPALGPGKVTGGIGDACSGGCVFKNMQDAVSVGIGDPPVWIVTGHKPTGATCTANDYTPIASTEKQACEQAPNGQTFCIKPDGQQCASASNGRQICWRPGETGQKTDREVAQKRNPGTDPTAPTPPPGETMTPKFPPQTTTTITNNTTITTTLTTGTTGSGTDAGGPGGTDSGQPGDGSGSGDGEGGGVGSVGSGLGALYESDGRSVSDAYGEFKGRVEGSTLVSSADGFFSGCIGGGSCPAATWDAGEWGFVHDLADLCAGVLSELLGWAGWVVLALAAFAAFRIGFL
jgi:hypothetical protein